MNAAKHGSIALWTFAIVAGLALSWASSTAEAQQFAAGRRPKVSAVSQASYEEDADPAPDMDYQPSSIAGEGVTYPNYAPESLPRRMSPPQMAQEQEPRLLPQSRLTLSAPAQRFEQSIPQKRIAPRHYSGRPARFVAQRSAAPQPAPQQKMILPAPSETRAELHPMDNPFEDVELPSGTPMHSSMDGSMEFGSADEGYDGGYPTGDCCGCHQCCCLFGPWLWDNFSVFGGVQGFKNSADLGTNGNFGFHAGVNWAFPVLDQCGIGFQIGTQGVFSDLSGTTTSGDTRSQSFTTFGLFHRPLCGVGLQYGVVWDYLHDDYSRASLDLSQFRTEIGFIGCRGNEIGFWSAIHTNDQSLRDTQTENQNARRTYQATDLFAFYYRRHFCNGGWFRFSGGFTSDSQGLLGADAMAPLTQCLALNTNFNYLIPNESTDTANARQEAWGLTINLVWYPACGRSCSGGPNPYRPLFGVADNTTFIVDRQ